MYAGIDIGAATVKAVTPDLVPHRPVAYGNSAVLYAAVSVRYTSHPLSDVRTGVFIPAVPINECGL